MDKNCLICKHSSLYPGEPGYSEMTPGSPASWNCEKNHWRDDPLSLQKEDFLKLIDKAKTCKDYLYYKTNNANGE